MIKRVSSHTPINNIAFWILTCFLLSGLSGLIYEILWTRMIVKIIGGSPTAVGIILTVFMGGMGIGAFLASRIIDRITEPNRLIRIYGILELVIGAYGLVIPLLLVVAKPVFSVLYSRLFSHFMLYNLLTFAGSSLILCVPAICMGATLPVLCRFYIAGLSRLGTQAGRLYGLNTIGAALGALLCGFWLINLLGVPGTLMIAVFINGIIGLFCLRVASDSSLTQAVAKRQQRTLGKYPPSDASAGNKFKETPEATNPALLIFAVSGFCAMAYEVMWTRLLGLIVGPTTYSFTMVLVTFILGLALGSVFFGWLGDRINRPLVLLLATQIAAALFALTVSQLLGNSQLFFAKLIFNFENRFILLSVWKAVLLFGFMILPTLCLGAAFPLVGKICTRAVSKVGSSIGFAYSLNTIGAVLGSFCAGFVLIPLAGKEKGLSLIIGLQLLVSLIVAVAAFGRRKGSFIKGAVLVVSALSGLYLCFYFPMWDRLLLSKGRYHRFFEIRDAIENYGWRESLLRGPEILAKLEHGKLVYYGDGIGGFTSVLKKMDLLGETYFVLSNNGKSDASSSGDMGTQTLLAHFAMLSHPHPKKVMVLGLASGVTAGEVLYYPVERLDVVDINEQVVSASDFFRPWNNNVLSHPKTNLIIQDGRAHLQLTRQTYDVIISEPSNPWMAGLAALFTREFFALAENRLTEGGIFAQWIHSYQMDWPTFALIGRTFSQVFPNSILVLSDFKSDYLLVGFKGNTRPKLEHAKQKMAFVRQSSNVTLSDPRLLYRLIVSEDLQTLFGQGPVNTDSRPRLEFAAPKLMYYYDPTISNKLQSGTLSAETQDIVNRLIANIDAQIDLSAYAFSIYAPFPDMVDLTKATAVQKERFFALAEAYCAKNTIDFTLLPDDDLKRRCRSVQIQTIKSNIDRIAGRELSYLYLAALYTNEGSINEAIAAYSESLRINPGNVDALEKLAGLYFKQKDIGQSIATYRAVLKLRPRREGTLNNLAWILATYEIPTFQDAIQAVQLAQRACRLANYQDPNLLDTLAAAYAAGRRFPEAIATAEKALNLARSSGLKQLEAGLAQRLLLYKDHRPYIEPLR